ncbi:MAG: phosphoribosylformylglycinamidine synthase subunit PurS [Candidatus Tectomicrobia bacterium]|nr:phosphoribosylformylglycinamidine synthase subunit PurS [Candidatus Tectomicrobia bacterium]
MAKTVVYVTYKRGVLDPQGEAVRGALASLGFQGVRGVRVGKYIEIDLANGRPEEQRAEVERMCRQLLANPVLEDFRIEISPSAPPE